jgi:hypothetical protein
MLEHGSRCKGPEVLHTGQAHIFFKLLRPTVLMGSLGAWGGTSNMCLSKHLLAAAKAPNDHASHHTTSRTDLCTSAITSNGLCAMVCKDHPHSSEATAKNRQQTAHQQPAGMPSNDIDLKHCQHHIRSTCDMMVDGMEHV